jgi:hypothetical protein
MDLHGAVAELRQRPRCGGLTEQVVIARELAPDGVDCLHVFSA